MLSEWVSYLNLSEDARYKLIQVFDVPDEEGSIEWVNSEEHVWTFVPLQDESLQLPIQQNRG